VCARGAVCADTSVHIHTAGSAWRSTQRVRRERSALRTVLQVLQVSLSALSLCDHRSRHRLACRRVPLQHSGHILSKLRHITDLASF
jgi:hypothetical protein